MPAHISTLVRQRGFALVGVFLAALLAFSGLVGLANVARAQGSIPVSYAEANPRTGYIEGNSCTSLPQSGYISGLSDDSWPGDEGNCSFIAAHYSRDGVDLVLRELRLDGDRVVLIPEIPAKQSADQAHVELSITLAELEKAKASLGESPIKLYYGDSSQFRRIALSLDSGMAASGGAQPDINVDGTAMTGSRLLYLFRELLPDGSVAYVRNVSVDVPRLWKITMRETTSPKTNQISFKQTNDNSTVDRTVQQFDVIYKGSSQTLVKAEVSAAKFDTVKLHASTFANIWDVGGRPALDEHGALNLHGEFSLKEVQSPYNAGGGMAQGRYVDGAVKPFFYKVMTTSGSSPSVWNSLPANKKDFRDALFRRTGIAVPARKPRNYQNKWPDHIFYNGKYCDIYCNRNWNDFANWDDSWHVSTDDHLLDASIDAPKPVSGNQSYDWGWRTDPRFVDQTDAANSTWPAVSGIKWEDNKTPLESNASGQGSYASFWVQFNGIENRSLRDDNVETWSYFLGRIRINNQWFSVPFPNMPKKALKPFYASTGCFLPLPQDWRYPNGRTWGWDLDDEVEYPADAKSSTGATYESYKFNTDCGTDYHLARARMFTPVDQPQYDAHDHAKTEYVSGDMFDTDAGSNFVYSGIDLTVPQMKAINSTSGRALQRTFSPVTLSETPIAVEYGMNAGVKIKVELVNTRSQGDLLADGFSRFTSSGKTVSRANRHTPSPRVGPAGQLTNNSVSDRSKLDWRMDGDADGGGGTNQRSVRRSSSQTNQWKTLYKVTVTGMMNPQMDLYFHYDYTSKPKWWNEFSLPAERVMVKESQMWRNNGGTFITEPTWRDRSTEGGIEATEACKANNAEAGWTNTARDVQKCDATIADDMPKPTDPSGNEANIKFDLRDGYVRPKLTTAYNRLQYDVCPDAEVQGAASVQHEHRDRSGNLVCERKAHNGKTWAFRWNYNNEEPFGFGRDSQEASKYVRTNTSTSFRVDADVVRVPSIVMTGTGADGAPSKAVTEQWKGNVLAAPTVDKESNYFMKVFGDVPAPITVEEGGQKVKKAFTGYQLYAVNCKEGTNCVDGVDDGVEAKLSRLYPSQVFLPGDVVDLRALNPETGDPMIRLSNDEYLGARYDAFWFVPTYGQPLKNTMKLYTGQKYLKRGKAQEKYGEPFHFYGAPGLNVGALDKPSAAANAWLPNSIVNNDRTYEYTRTIDSVSTKQPITLDEIEPVKFLYEAPTPAELSVNVTYVWLDGTQNTEYHKPRGENPELYIGDRPEQDFPVTVNVSSAKVSSDFTEDGTHQFGQPYEDFDVGDNVTISFSYKRLNNKLCIAMPTTHPSTVAINKENRGSLAPKGTGGNETLTTALKAGSNTIDLTVKLACYSYAVVYPMGDIDAKYKAGDALKPADDTVWKDYAPVIETAPNPWHRFMHEVEGATLQYPTAAEPSTFTAKAYTNERTDTTVDAKVTQKRSEINPALNGSSRYSALPVGYWDFTAPQQKRWATNSLCPSPLHAQKDGVALAGVAPGEILVCYAELVTSEVSLISDMSASLANYWQFTVGDSAAEPNTDTLKNTGTAVAASNTRNYQPGVIRVSAAGTSQGDSPSMDPVYYRYTGNNPAAASTSSTEWEKLVSGATAKRWYANNKAVQDAIEADALYVLNGTDAIALQDGKPQPVVAPANKHLVLKVEATPFVRPELPLTGGIPADYILLAGLSILGVGGAIAVLTIRKRRKAY